MKHKVPPAAIAASALRFAEVESRNRRIIRQQRPLWPHACVTTGADLKNHSLVCAHTVRVFLPQPVRDSGAPGGPDYHRDHLHAAGMGGLVEAALCGERQQQHLGLMPEKQLASFVVFVCVLFRDGGEAGVDVQRVFLSTCSACKNGEYLEIQDKRPLTAPLDVSPQLVVLTVILNSHAASSRRAEMVDAVKGLHTSVMCNFTQRRPRY